MKERKRRKKKVKIRFISSLNTFFPDVLIIEICWEKRYGEWKMKKWSTASARNHAKSRVNNRCRLRQLLPATLQVLYTHLVKIVLPLIEIKRSYIAAAFSVVVEDPIGSINVAILPVHHVN